MYQEYSTGDRRSDQALQESSFEDQKGSIVDIDILKKMGG